MNKENIKQDYLSGLTYKTIQDKYNITNSQLIYLIQKNKWKRKSNRSKTKKGNKNAKGNKGGPGAKKGNKQTLVTGEYENIFSGVLSEFEQNVFDNYKVENKKNALLEELKILTIRELRMLDRIKILNEQKSKMYINTVSKINEENRDWKNNHYTSTTANAENVLNAIQRIEEALTRVQEAKRRCIDTLNKMETDDRKLELDLIRLEREISKEGNSNPENLQDDSFIKALNDSVEDTWDDYGE